jgi:hypothetical protein
MADKVEEIEPLTEEELEAFRKLTEEERKMSDEAQAIALARKY